MIDVEGMTNDERYEALSIDLERMGADIHQSAERIAEQLRIMANALVEDGNGTLDEQMMRLLAETARLEWLSEEVGAKKRLDPTVTSLVEVQEARRGNTS